MGVVTLENSIYFDNAATALINKEYLKSQYDSLFGSSDFSTPLNPSSPHRFGDEASLLLESSREKIMKVFGQNEGKIIFTSGGTESNNLSIIGRAKSKKKQKLSFFALPWEHPSVLEPLKYVSEEKLAGVQIAPFEEWVIPGQGFVSIVMSQVSHETGDINDIEKIVNLSNLQNPNVSLQIDGMQGFCKAKFPNLPFASYSASSHKIHGLSGTGFLFVKKGFQMKPLFFGGKQESGFRPGTEPVFLIAMMAESIAKLSVDIDSNITAVKEIKEKLLCLEKNLPDVCINNKTCSTSPYILNMSFLGVKAEVLVRLLSENGVHASMGAACNSKSKDKSALEKMGFSKEVAESAVRFSFSHLNNLDEAVRACEIVEKCVIKLRKVGSGS